jgi:hypothetical protein
MEDLTIPSVGACFKKWGRCTPILRKCQEVPQKSSQKNNKIKNLKWGLTVQGARAAAGHVTAGRRLASSHGVGPLSCTIGPLFLPPSPIFFLMWSTPPHWLQHMPALPRLLLKTSITHNF